MASIEWPEAISALHAGHLPCSAGENRMLRIIASLADGIPVNLRETPLSLRRHRDHPHLQAIARDQNRILNYLPL
jgi:hypothetical protein